MSSNSIYPHVPYFYVIEHVASGKRYVGCRYAKGCNPVEFMTEGGYQTSSTTIKKIIEEEGLESFKTVEIKTSDEVGDVYDYETDFLVENDCAKSEQWLNKHNNTKMAFGSKEFKAAMLAKRGVEHALQTKEAKEQKRKTCLDRYGHENPMQSEEVQEKSKQTCLNRYGFEHASQSEEVQEKSKQTCLKNHGVDSYSKTKEHRERTIKLHFERFNSRVKTEILNGDFSRFIYLYDTVENVFLMGDENSLNRGLETKRYIRITTNRSGCKKYIDTKTRETYRIDVSKFSIPLPDNFVR
jgi:hypothetical protein